MVRLHARSVTAFAALALVAFAPGLRSQPAPEPATGWQRAPEVRAMRSMIVAANPHAVDAGHAMLRRGGSAVDAAIAAQLMLGLVEPQSSGLGGGGFMLVHDARSRRALAYDGRETAPSAATPERFLDAQGRPLRFAEAVIGGRSVGVPGVVALLAEVHRRHGRLRWSELFEPAIDVAERGFVVSPRFSTMLALEGSSLAIGRAGTYFFHRDGAPLRAGELLRNPAYASTLRRVATEGASAFYRGAIAQDIVTTVGEAPAPGDMSLGDLANYRVIVREPVCGPYRGHRVCSMPLPSSGGPTLLQMLAYLAPYDLAAMGPASFWSVHFISEAGRLAYADRSAYMADPAFVAPPAWLLDPTYLRERAALIKPTASLGRASPGSFVASKGAASAQTGTHQGLEFAATSHISVVDAQGNAVAFTTSIERGFGSRLMTKSGFLLNNQLTDFSFRPVEDGRPVANRVQPGKRPRSSMAPTIVYDRAGRVVLVAGSPGGSAIINYVAKTLIAVLDWNLGPGDSIAMPNFGSRNGPTELERNTGVSALAGKLEAMGHQVSIIDQTSGVHAIVRAAGGGWIGAADPRREGVARGQ